MVFIILLGYLHTRISIPYHILVIWMLAMLLVMLLMYIHQYHLYIIRDATHNVIKINRVNGWSNISPFRNYLTVINTSEFLINMNNKKMSILFGSFDIWVENWKHVIIDSSVFLSQEPQGVEKKYIRISGSF